MIKWSKNHQSFLDEMVLCCIFLTFVGSWSSNKNCASNKKTWFNIWVSMLKHTISCHTSLHIDILCISNFKKRTYKEFKTSPSHHFGLNIINTIITSFSMLVWLIWLWVGDAKCDIITLRHNVGVTFYLQPLTCEFHS